jgi:uncharacterized protein YggE
MKRYGSVLFVLGIASAVVGLLLFGGTSAPHTAAVAADVPTTTNGIVVDGTGRTSGTPDVLRVTLGVNVHRSDVSSAMQAANTRQAKVRSSLRKHGVAEKDLQTSDVSVYPDFDNHGRPNGYRVSETLTAKLRDLKKAGQAISDAVQAGGDEATVQGVSFSLEDNADLLKQARDAAFADAQAKAERYAQLAKRSLGEVQLVAETSNPQLAQPVPFAYDAARASALKEVPIDAGTSDVSVTVTVRWALR